MKAVLITFNLAWTDELYALLDDMKIRGFTQWSDVRGRGTRDGEPRMGTHTWPSLNGALLCVVEEEKVSELVIRLRSMDETAPEQGLKAFVWEASMPFP